MKRSKPWRQAVVAEVRPLDALLSSYQESVRGLESVADADPAWMVAEAREALADRIKADKPDLAYLKVVDESDQRAKAALARLTGEAVRRFEQMRDARDADAKAWWWAPANCANPTSGALCVALAATCWGLALTLTLGTIDRWLVGGPDWSSALAVSIQAVVVLLGGATFVDWGRRWLVSLTLMARRPIGQHHMVALWVTLVALGIAVAVRASLPVFADLYQRQGQTDFRAGRLASALENWRRGASLNPDSWELRYQLGSALERMADTDKAIAEYRLAVASPEAPIYVHNNLARLYLAQKGDASSALALLEPALVAYQEQDPVRYRLLVNRGAAYLSLGHVQLAKHDAQAALKLANALGWNAMPSAYCLIALAAKEATKPWAQCLSPSDQDEVSDPRWKATAKEQLVEPAK